MNQQLIALEALRGIFEHCAMVHKHWGENCNQQEADAAIALGRAAIAKAEAEKTYALSYAYDVPHYADFCIKAKSEAEALKIAQAALDAGRFSNVVGRPFYDNLGNERVFIEGEASPLTEADQTLEELLAASDPGRRYMRQDDGRTQYICSAILCGYTGKAHCANCGYAAGESQVGNSRHTK